MSRKFLGMTLFYFISKKPTWVVEKNKKAFYGMKMPIYKKLVAIMKGFRSPLMMTFYFTLHIKSCRINIFPLYLIYSV